MYDYLTQSNTTYFYYYTKGIYEGKSRVLKELKEELKELLELHKLLNPGSVDKEKVKRLKEQIKKMNTEIEILEFLYKGAFNKEGGLEGDRR